MENFVLSFEVVAPLMIYILIGMVLRKVGVLSATTCRELSQLVFFVTTPALCFHSIIKTDFSVILGDPFALYIVAGIVVLFVLCMLVVPLFCKDNRRRGVLVQSIFRSNDGIFGLAVASALMGAENMGLMSLCVALSVPLFNIFAVIDMETFRGGRIGVGKLLLRVVKNPLVIACVVAIVLNLLGVQLPKVLDSTIERIGNTCAPLGFIALGGALSFAAAQKNKRAIGVVSLLRLVISPILFVGLMYLLGYRGDHLLVALIIFGAPTAMGTYAMACAMDGDDELASGTVAITSVLSILTMFIFIFLLKELGVA